MPAVPGVGGGEAGLDWLSGFSSPIYFSVGHDPSARPNQKAKAKSQKHQAPPRPCHYPQPCFKVITSSLPLAHEGAKSIAPARQRVLPTLPEPSRSSSSTPPGTSSQKPVLVESLGAGYPQKTDVSCDQEIRFRNKEVDLGLLRFLMQTATMWGRGKRKPGEKQMWALRLLSGRIRERSLCSILPCLSPHLLLTPPKCQQLSRHCCDPNVSPLFSSTPGGDNSRISDEAGLF